MQLKPALTGWVARPRPFDFGLGPGALREDAFRFLNGTPHIPAFYAAPPGLEIVRQVGVQRIRRRSLELTRWLIGKARGREWRIHTPEAESERAGTVTLDVPRGPCDAARGRKGTPGIGTWAGHGVRGAGG